ncbi:transcription factor GTE4-like protein isoform X1 [Tanacetum coccineum]
MVLPRPAANVPFRRTPVPKKPKAREPNKRDMTYEEKQKLSSNLQNLPLDHLDGVVQIIKKTNTLKIKRRAEIQQARALAGNDTIQNPIVYVPDAPNEQTTDEQGPAPTPLNQRENRGDNASSSSSNSSSSDSDSDSSSEEGSPRGLVHVKQATIETLGYLCEEVSLHVVEQDQVNKILTVVIQGMNPTDGSNDVKLVATSALYNALS